MLSFLFYPLRCFAWCLQQLPGTAASLSVMLCCVEISWLTWKKNFLFRYLAKLFGSARCMIWIIIYLQYKVVPYQFCSIRLSLSSRARYTSEFILLLLSAARSSVNTSDFVPLAAIHPHAITQSDRCLLWKTLCLSFLTNLFFCL